MQSVLKRNLKTFKNTPGGATTLKVVCKASEISVFNIYLKSIAALAKTTCMRLGALKGKNHLRCMMFVHL